MTSLAVLRDPTLRMIALAMLLLGALNASVYPYQSLVGIERIGLSEPAFALILAGAVWAHLCARLIERGHDPVIGGIERVAVEVERQIGLDPPALHPPVPMRIKTWRGRR